jgi:hypothetical protein
MLARIRSAWRAWRERNRQYAIDRAVYKMGGAPNAQPLVPTPARAQSAGLRPVSTAARTAETSVLRPRGTPPPTHP